MCDVGDQKNKGLVPALRFPEFQNAGAWRENTFGDAAIFLNGRAYKQEELLDQGKYRVLRVGNFFSNNQWYYSDLELDDGKYCDKGDLLYAWSASFGPRIWHGEKVIYHYHIWKVLEKNEINKKFLFILLEHETERMKSQSANGLGLMHITKGAIESWKCCIPNIEEQQKLADCLASIDDLITAETQKLAALKIHKKGLMQQLFPAEGETVPRLRFPEFRDAGEWIIRKFSKYIVLYRGSSPRPIENYLTSDSSGVNWIKIGDTKYAENFIISQVKEKITPEGAKKSRKVNVGELILANSMSYGKTYQISITGCIYDGWFVLRDYEKHFNKQFLLQLLNSEYMQNQYEKLSAGGIVQNISSDIVYQTVLPNTLLKEQQKIADCLSSVDELIAAQGERIDALKLHKKGLMQQLFPVMEEVDA